MSNRGTSPTVGLDHVVDLVLVVDAAGRIRSANTAAWRILGYDPAEKVGTNALDLVHPDDGATAAESLVGTAARAGRTTRPVRVRVRRSDGSWCDLEVLANNLLDDPDVAGVVITGRECEQSFPADGAVRENERRMHAAFDAAPIGMGLVDLGGRFLRANRALGRLSGQSPDELVGRSMAELIDPVERDTVVDALGRLVAGSMDGYESEARWSRGDGSSVVVRLSASMVDDEDRHPLYLSLQVVDLSERVAVEEALRAREQQYRLIVESTNEGFWAIDAAGVTTFVNRRMGEMLGWDPGEMVGVHFFDFMEADAREAAGARLERGLDAATGMHDLRLRHRNGSDVWTRLARSPLADLSGNFVGAIAVVTDITEQRRVDEGVRLAQDRFRTLVQESSDLILVLAEDGTVDYASPAIEPMLGYPPEGIRGSAVRTLVVDDDTVRELLGGELHAVERMGERASSEVRFRHRDDTVRYCEVVVRELTDDPSVHGIVLNARDVTETRRAERQLRALFEESNDIITVLHPDGSWFASPAGTRILGHPPGYEPEGGLLSLVHPDDVDEATAALGEALAGARPSTDPLEVRVAAADGSYRWLETFVRDGTDDPLIDGVVITARDVTERRAQAAALRESERRFAAAFERSPVAVALIGLDGRAIDCNAEFCRMLDRSRDEIVGEDTLTLVHPDDRYAVVAQSTARLESDVEELPDPTRMLRRDGSIVWVRSDSHLMTDDDGAASSVVATMLDITAQREAEEKLQTSEHWYRTLVSHQSDIVTVVGNDGEVLYISPSVETVLGIKPEEMIGGTGAEGVHPDDIDRLFSSLTDQLDRGSDARPVEYRQRCSDDSWLWLEATGQYLPDDLGVDGVIVTARDISERKRAEAQQRETDTQFQAAFAASPLGIGFADLTGQIVWVNRALAGIVGIAEDDLRAMKFQELSSPDEFEMERAETRRLLRGEIDSFLSEKRYDHPAGRTVWALLYVSLIRDTDGKPKYVVGQLEDITERKQRELELTHDAEHDLLTGLQNRAGLRATLARMWAERSTERPMAVLFGDLDRFKPVNDTFGHQAGDEVLAHVARRLQQVVRGGDVVARWGGDEFVVVCAGVADLDEAATIGERIRLAMAEPFRVAAGEFRVGMSVGVAIDRGHSTPDELLADADAAAFRAKGEGRSCVAVAPGAAATAQE
ncbi:MAG: PAS domain S-box protein [Acidimicrobiia bacterium]